jgi:hypothetical protein
MVERNKEIECKMDIITAKGNIPVAFSSLASSSFGVYEHQNLNLNLNLDYYCVLSLYLKTPQP